MRTSPAGMAVGCVTGLISLAGLVGGIYQGISDAKGYSMDGSLEKLITYGPAVINAGLGLVVGPLMAEDNKEEMADRLLTGNPYASREAAENFNKGCFTMLSPVLGGGITAGFCYGGYLIGRAMGSSM